MASAFLLSCPETTNAIPQCVQNVTRNFRRKGKTAVQSSTLYKEDFEKSLETELKTEHTKRKLNERFEL